MEIYLLQYRSEVQETKNTIAVSAENGAKESNASYKLKSLYKQKKVLLKTMSAGSSQGNSPTKCLRLHNSPCIIPKNQRTFLWYGCIYINRHNKMLCNCIFKYVYIFM